MTDDEVTAAVERTAEVLVAHILEWRGYVTPTRTDGELGWVCTCGETFGRIPAAHPTHLAAALRDANLLADPDLTRERDEALAAVERVRHAEQLWVTDADGRSFWALPNDDLRAALGEAE